MVPAERPKQMFCAQASAARGRATTGPGGTVNRWRQRPLRLSPDGDMPTHAPVQPPIIVLRDRDRYRLMTRYRLTPDQVDRLPVDIAWTLLRLPRSARKRTPTRTAIRSSSFQPGDPVTGGWCVVCGLPSLIRVPLYVLSPRGVSLWRSVEGCAEDGMHTPARQARAAEVRRMSELLDW